MQIVLPIIACLLIIGAWRGWRGSPLYSGRKTREIKGAVLLIVAAIIGACAAIFGGPLERSPLAMAIAGILAIVVVGTGASVLLIRITDPEVAPLPPAAKIITSHRRNVYRWLRRIGVYLLVSALAAWLVPAPWTWLPLFLGGFVLIGCGPMLAALFMRARRLDLGMSALIAAPWVHWQYAPAQWQSWANRDRSWRRRRRLLAAPPEAYFGADGVYCNGEYTPWALSGAFLAEAAVPPDPPARVRLTFHTFNGNGSRRVAQSILIPDGRESDLGILQSKLRISCRTAIVRLAAGR